MKKLLITIGVGILLFSTNALACGGDVAKKPLINDALKEKIIKTIKVPDIKTIEYSSEIPGYFEVFDGRSVLYVSYDLKYLISGNLFVVESGKNLTLNASFKSRVDWSLLPLDLAIESGDLKSSNKIAIFTDPDCPVCQKFEVEVGKTKGVHIYTFLNPLTGLHPESRNKSKVILCSKDKHKAYIDFTMNGRALTGGEDLNSCEDKMKKLDALSDRLKFNSTPTVVNSSGMVFKGALTSNDLFGFSTIDTK